MEDFRNMPRRIRMVVRDRISRTTLAEIKEHMSLFFLINIEVEHGERETAILVQDAEQARALVYVFPKVIERSEVIKMLS